MIQTFCGLFGVCGASPDGNLVFIFAVSADGLVWLAIHTVLIVFQIMHVFVFAIAKNIVQC